MNIPDYAGDGKSKEYSDAAQGWRYSSMYSSFAWMSKELFFLEKRMMNGRKANDIRKEVAQAKTGCSIGNQEAQGSKKEEKLET